MTTKADNEHGSLQSISTASISELAALYDAKGSGLTADQLRQTRVPLGALTVAPKVFQPRNMEDKSWTKEQHVSNLAKAVRETGALDAIDVFAIDGKLYIVDGHCRLDAYRHAGVQGSERIPVRLVAGTLADALARAGTANVKDKLSFTLDDKLELAWRMVVLDASRRCYSLREINKATRASKSTVANMRCELAALDAAPDGLSWRDMKRRRRAETELDEDWKERQARNWAVRLRKLFGDKPDVLPDVLLDAFEDAYPSVLSLMLERLAVERGEEILELAERVASEGDF